ncbi:dipicolinate synthase subunit DpsA [Jeotgalibacillus proteolyticus]|uniref:Dipicolinate synthase subunit A n=1 Tax=Jeotgalibacillus proteolyticus TaxID=2082395 RepID=A0A2S5GGG3_9BACL|nr:dipicolinate synthase subunit DpsA [Jeotgalibacillus proteolyticus]PPA72014.1 dipicolinate synthase subunit A [Jeotgalibacillus proteolyticus]
MTETSSLESCNIAIIGGDARQKEIAHHCQMHGANLMVVGFDQLALTEPGFTKMESHELPYEELDAIVFPVSGVGEEGAVRSSFSSKPLTLDLDLFRRLNPTCKLFSGIQTPWLDSLNRPVVYLMEEDQIAIQNSIPTAEGVIWLLLQHTDHTIHGSTILVTGFGRIGITIASRLKALGAKVFGGTADSGEKARMLEMGIEPVDLSKIDKKLHQCDAWVNTIPSDKVFPLEVISKVSHTCIVIELASGPKAIDQSIADSIGLRYIDAPSLPGIIAPKTAGLILASAIIERLSLE